MLPACAHFLQILDTSHWSQTFSFFKPFLHFQFTIKTSLYSPAFSRLLAVFEPETKVQYSCNLFRLLGKQFHVDCVKTNVSFN